MKQSELVKKLAVCLHKTHTQERIIYKNDTDKRQLEIASMPYEATILRWLIDNNVMLIDMKD